MANINIENFSERLQKLRLLVEQELPVINARMATSAFSLVENRIVNDGLKANGSSLGKYSENPLPAFFFTSNALGSGADAKAESLLKKNKKNGINGISYKDWRGVNGLQTNHIDLQFTGETWKDFAILKTESTPESALTTIQSKGSIKRGSKSTADIADYNAERFGDYLALSEDEEKEIDIAFDNELQQLLDEVFEQ
jgi:hypothetical protein